MSVLQNKVRDCPYMEQVCYTIGPETVHTWGRCVTLWGQRLSIHGVGVLHYRIIDCPYMEQVCYTIES